MTAKELGGVIARVSLAAAKKVSDGRLDALEARIAALEARGPGMKYCGVWVPPPAGSDGYMEGDTVTKGGSMWTCRLNHVHAEPNTEGGSACWQLSVKHGRDAR